MPHTLITLTCRCGCNRTWKALKEPHPDDQYFAYSHRPRVKEMNAWSGVTTNVDKRMKCGAYDKYETGDEDSVILDFVKGKE